MTAPATSAPATSAPATTINPIGSGERIELVDVLRGFAMFGVLLANFWGHRGTLLPRADAVAYGALDLLVWDSFYPLFAFLFGLSFAVQLLRAQERGRSVTHLYVRRLLVLFVIGAAHAILLWDGDILTEYAVLGLFLIPLSWLPVRAMFGVVVLVLAFQFAPAAGYSATPRLRGASYEAAELERASIVEARNLLRGRVAGADGKSRHLMDHVRLRAFDWAASVRRVLDWRRVLVDDITLCFVIGLYVGRRRLLHEAAAHRRGLMAALALGAILPITGYLVLNYVRPLGPFAREYGWLASSHALTMFYVALIALIHLRAGSGARRLRWLAPAGRMALTNYLTQSLVMTLVFFPYGLHLDGGGTTLRMAVHAVFYLGMQVPFSHWWLARFRVGPAEWVWRSLTYGARQPMRRQ